MILLKPPLQNLHCIQLAQLERLKNKYAVINVKIGFDKDTTKRFWQMIKNTFGLTEKHQDYVKTASELSENTMAKAKHSSHGQGQDQRDYKTTKVKKGSTKDRIILVLGQIGLCPTYL